MKVVLQDVTMTFHDVHAVKRLSAVIEHGKLVSLLGPSGCGKSTTLFLLAGLYKPSKGDIWFGEQWMNAVEPEHREVGMVFQNYALYPHMTVLKNIMFPLRMKKMKRSAAEEKARAMAKLVHISHLLDRKPGQLSGGQQQRVAIARALVKEPKLLLLDEPLSNLDARLRVEMREEIRRIQQEVGITTVFVTHDQEEAMSISDKVLLMNEGNLQQYASPLELYRRPCNAFAAQFIGNPRIHLLDAEFDAAGRVLRLRGMDAQVSLPEGQFADLTPGNTYQLGIRAEDWIVVEPGTGVLQGKITYMETIGRDTQIRVQSGSVSVRALLPSDTVWRIGMNIGLDIRPAGIHVFDGDTGESLNVSNRESEAVSA